MRAAALAAVVLAVAAVGQAACVETTAFRCESDAQCVSGAGDGVCEATGFCSFLDAACDSGRRYGDAAGDGLGGECVGDGAVSCSGALALRAGNGFACALDGAGRVSCWGRNDLGQLGVGDTVSRSEPTGLGALADIVELDLGDRHACAVRRDGYLSCWGDGSYGRLGVADTVLELPALVMAGVTDVEVETISCAIAGGQVWCWGPNENGRLGDGTATNRYSPVPVATSAPAVKLAVGGGHTCALLDGGAVDCWGLNDVGQLGDGTVEVHLVPTAVPDLVDVVELTAGGSHTCARKADASVWCWGENGAGQIGDGSTQDRRTPTKVLGLAATRVQAGPQHTCALRADGALLCWGDNSGGKLGDGSFDSRTAPAEVASMVGALEVAPGASHTCAQAATGAVACWGDNGTGQLGTGGILSSSEPVVVAGQPEDTASVSAGNNHGCALSTRGEVFCWGDNLLGQRGAGSLLVPAEPVSQPVGLASVDELASIGNHSCARAGGEVSCWGSATPYSVLGDGQVTTVLAPAPAAGGGGATALALGQSHTCVMTAAGSSCWGGNGSGELGSGTASAELATPVAVTITSAAPSQLAPGGGFTCALVGATVECWGTNGQGQLGDGTVIGNSAAVVSPVLPAEPAPIAIVAGNAHACALLEGGAVWCWGDNESGQAGTGGVGGDALVPVQVAGLSASALVVRGSTSCALRAADATAWCWGSNTGGKLGAGTLASASGQPVQTSEVGFTALALGDRHACGRTATGEIRCWGSNDRGQLGDGRLLRSVEPTPSLLSCDLP